MTKIETVEQLFNGRTVNSRGKMLFNIFLDFSKNGKNNSLTLRAASISAAWTKMEKIMQKNGISRLGHDYSILMA